MSDFLRLLIIVLLVLGNAVFVAAEYALVTARRTRLEPAPARGHERVLGRHENRVPQHQQHDDEEAEEVAHAPSPGAWVLGGISSNSAAQYRDRSRRPERV